MQGSSDSLGGRDEESENEEENLSQELNRRNARTVELIELINKGSTSPEQVVEALEELNTNISETQAIRRRFLASRGLGIEDILGTNVGGDTRIFFTARADIATRVNYIASSFSHNNYGGLLFDGSTNAIIRVHIVGNSIVYVINGVSGSYSTVIQTVEFVYSGPITRFKIVGYDSEGGYDPANDTNISSGKVRITYWS